MLDFDKIRKNLKLHIFLISLMPIGLQLLGLLSFSWEILNAGGSRLLLGTNLALVSLVPFLLKKSSIINACMKNNTKKFRVILSSTGAFFVFILALLNLHESFSTYLLVASFIYSTITSLLVQSSEQVNLYCKINGLINSEESSKISNYASQLGSIVFALLFGFITHHYGFPELLFVCALTMLILAILSYSCDIIIPQDTLTLSEEKAVFDTCTKNYQKDILLLLSLAVVNAVVTFILILTMNMSPNFNAQMLGIADAFAGIGAVVGIYIASKSQLIKRITFVIILITAQLSFVSLFSEFLIYLSIFAWGLSLNAIRYQVRISLNSKINSYQSALEVSIYLVNGTVLVNALTPLIISVSLKIISAFEMMLVISLLVIFIFLLNKR